MTKKDESKFKVDDWVTYLGKLILVLTTEEAEAFSLGNDYKLWQPQEDEWCVFYDNSWDGNNYMVAKFDYIVRDKYKAYTFSIEDAYECIAPLEFIQTLNQGD